MSLDISGKHILLLGIGFYDYETAISKELCRRGAKIYFIDAVYKSFLKKVLLRLNRHLLQKIASRYLLNQIARQPKEIDYVIIIKGDALQEEHISLLKGKYSNAKMLLYLWDSINRISNSELLLKNFDRILTFDRVDAINYNLVFRPLFYRYEICKNETCSFDYDISFIGCMHSDRYKILHRLKKIFEQDDIKYKFIIYTNISSYFIARYIKKSIDKRDSNLFVFKPVSFAEYTEISLKSKVILDLPHPLQKGLTMRSIESVGFKRKLLTTNVDIRNYPMIDAHNYALLDNKELLFDYSVFDGAYICGEQDYKFSLCSFVNDLLLNIECK